MGIEIDRTKFAPDDYAAFRQALEGDLDALRALLARPGFGAGPGSVGAELEMYIVDADGRPLHANQEILDAAGDAQLALELNRYNLEYNLTPRALDAAPFAALEREILERLAYLRGVAADFGGRIVPIGILPTLRQSDFGAHCITDRKRFHALVQQLLLRRGGQFRVDIHGEQPLELEMADITLEGANTSFQVHYRVAPEDFAATFNAIQLVTPLAVAVAANSPTLFGHNLWHETRVPLFKQSIDTRYIDRYSWNEPPRVNFGQGWVRRGALELFAEVVRIYPPLLPVCSGAREPAAGAPALSELRLHQSTVWLWNRPVYDDTGDGHLRIEMRALPAGPSAIDMVANAALLIGLAEGLRGRIDDILPAIPFGIAEYNFYRAAQHGLFARVVWPEAGQSGYREQPVGSVIRNLLPLAAAGLAALGIDAAEAQRYLGVIERRLETCRTGAIWQRSRLSALRREMAQEEALHTMLEEFIDYSTGNAPVSEWPL
ncbi:MAG: glutamate--cysteine ligase [Halioglobus sp.]|nr:glutamate--cysteine ligase [Halioglobus sp.]